MFLLEPGHTQFDLRFRLFGIPVRVHPAFWIVIAVLGWGGGPGEGNSLFLPRLLVWVGACFLSILIHEMGHVFMGRQFGADGHIVLYSFGGLAIGSNALADGRKRALVSFAGPLAQFLLLGVILAVAWSFIVPPELRPLLTLDWDIPFKFFVLVAASPHHPLVRYFFIAMMEINVFWPILNLLPIWPLDGGQISREVCVGLSRERGLRVSLGISLVVAALLAVNALATIHKGNGEPLLPGLRHGEPLIPVVGWLFAGGWFMVLFFALFAIQSLQLLQAAEAERRWQDDHWQD